MGAGLPTIVSLSTGSIIRDGVDGFLIESGNQKALKEKMLWFKNHPEQIIKMGKNARDRVSNFTWETYSENVYSCYKSVF